MFNDTFWLDVRGNHDSANQDRSSHHYFYNYTTCGHLGRVYNKVYEKSFGTYCFVGVDSTLSPCISFVVEWLIAPGVLLTYFGYVDRQSQHSLRAVLDSNKYFYPLFLNQSILQSHYSIHPLPFSLLKYACTSINLLPNTSFICVIRPCSFDPRIQSKCIHFHFFWIDQTERKHNWISHPGFQNS